jgi:hypothetical protein
MFITALLVLHMHWTDIPLIEAGQTHAPVCIEYCQEGAK